jgi:hypothetical protein
MVSRGESFFALAANEARALEVSVDGEKIEVYAVMSAVVTLEVSQHCSLAIYQHISGINTYVKLLPMRLILIFQVAGVDQLLYLRQAHGKRFGSVDVAGGWVDLESSRYGLREVIFDDSLPIGEYIIRRGHFGCGIEELTLTLWLGVEWGKKTRGNR